MRAACLFQPFETMAADSLSVTEQWIREKLSLQHNCLADVRSLNLPGSYETGKIRHLGISLKNFVRLKSLDLSHNALESVQGIVHLKLLEKLNLYYNRISSLEDVLALRQLQNLKELDLRLNPVVQKHPYYRLYMVHAISKLRKLDDCSVRDRDRKAALMHFSVESAFEPNRQNSKPVTQEKRSSDPRIASLNRMMMSKFALREGNEEIVLNDKFNINENVEAFHPTEKKTKPESTHSPENPSEIIHLVNAYDSDVSSLQKQDTKPSFKTSGRDESHMQKTVRRRPSLKLNEVPRVTFVDSSVTSHSRIQTEGNFTPHPSNKTAPPQGEHQKAQVVNKYLERERIPVLHPPRLTFRNSENDGDQERTSLVRGGKQGKETKPSLKTSCIDGEHKKAPVVKEYPETERNPVLHPPRLTFRNSENEEDQQKASLGPERAGKQGKGAYRKPMELLLSLVDEYWAGKKKTHNTKHFFMHAVRILCMMEQEVVSGEEEMKTLKEKIQKLTNRAELQEKRHQSEVCSLSGQLQRAHDSIEQLDEQLRSVLEENLSLQKQLIRLEQKLLSEQLREMSNTGE